MGMGHIDEWVMNMILAKLRPLFALLLAATTLLALQSVEDPALKKRQLVRRGKALLDVLEELKTDLLIGRVSEGKLNLLMALVHQAREQSEPGLDGLLDDIELRARVELAKRGLFPNR